MLLELQQQGFAMRSADDTADDTWSDWQITREGLLGIEFGHRFVEPRQVSHVPLPLRDEDLPGATSYELIRHMESKGWSWERLPGKPSRAIAAYQIGNDNEPLVWRTRSRTASPAYLRCLLQAQKLKTDFNLSLIHI